MEKGIVLYCSDLFNPSTHTGILPFQIGVAEN